MPPNLAVGPLTRLKVLWHACTLVVGLRGVPPSTDGTATVTWRGETCASGRAGGNLVVGWVQTMFGDVPMG
jgi:hypothetical protein